MHDVVRIVFRRRLKGSDERLDDCVAGEFHSRHFAESDLPSSARAASLAARFSAGVRWMSLTRSPENLPFFQNQGYCACSRNGSLPRSFFQWIFDLARKMPAPFLPPGMSRAMNGTDVEPDPVVDVRPPADSLILYRLPPDEEIERWFA